MSRLSTVVMKALEGAPGTFLDLRNTLGISPENREELRTTLRSLIGKGKVTRARNNYGDFVYSLAREYEPISSKPPPPKNNKKTLAEIRQLETKARQPGTPLQTRQEISYRVGILRGQL